ncbi:MAG: hypothetical protein JNM56_16770 [Planctomycetia bacterium]|nr:hypothetical protein [Planctomycetia bacterium]
MKSAFGLPLVVSILGWLLASAQPPAEVKRGPANRWSKLPTPTASPYSYSQPLYIPARKQVLHWGAVVGNDAPANDVRALDAVRGTWVSDYASASKDELAKARSAGLGVTSSGRGGMLASGTPAPAQTVNGVCYDSKRDRLIYVMKGLTAAYDPATKKWHDLKAEAEVFGPFAHWPDLPYARYERGLRPEKEYRGERLPGSPPAYGIGCCYDPVNDEIVLFPHWGGQNTDQRAATGRVSAHTGTWVYSCRDNLWRRVGHTFGTAEVKRGRGYVKDLIARVSQALDTAWDLRQRPDKERQAEMAKVLQSVASEVQQGGGPLPAAARESFARVLPSVQSTAAVAAAGKLNEVAQSGAAALRHLEAVLDQALRVEPPPRCATPLVYDPRTRVIVMFGGHSGLVRTDLEARECDPEARSLNDTWLYDATTKQWREVPCKHRPPAQRQPLLAFDDKSGLVLLVTRALNEKKELTVTLWSFDPTKGEWSKRHEEAWTGQVREGAGLALDAASRMLVLTQGPDTYVCRLDLETLPAAPAPADKPPPGIVAPVIPLDDPAWVTKLKELPANQWVHPRPPRDAEDRGWGTLAYDDVRGLVCYFGGGHSTYQVNDVAIYSPGVNRWVHPVGEHNDWVPPVHWDGIAMGYRGGPPAGHQRNSYVVIDGRLFLTNSFYSRRWDVAYAKDSGTRVSWFYDLDRDAWRQRPIGKVELGPGVPGSYGRAHLADPSGKVLGFAGHLEPYDGRFFKDEAYFSSHDIHTNQLTVRKIAAPTPNWVGECRPFCYLADRNQVFYYEYREGGGHATWVYDIKENRFTDLKPKRQPPADPRTVEYLPDQGAVFAVIGKGEQWVYSFKHNTWAPLALASDSPVGFASPYAQVVYAGKHGVLVNAGSHSRGVAVMRPDVSASKWD